MQETLYSSAPLASQPQSPLVSHGGSVQLSVSWQLVLYVGRCGVAGLETTSAEPVAACVCASLSQNVGETPDQSAAIGT